MTITIQVQRIQPLQRSKVKLSWGGTRPAVGRQRVPFSDATPAEIREVLLPDELPEFKRQYRRALEVAAETFSLDELGKNTAVRRRIAWMTDSDPEAHRRMLHNVEHALRTGQSPLGSVPWNELKARLGLEVAYEIEVYPDAGERIDALPPEVRSALAEAMIVLTLLPWSGVAYSDDKRMG